MNGEPVDRVRSPEVVKFINDRVMTGMAWTDISKDIDKSFGFKPTTETVKKVHGELALRQEMGLIKDNELMGEYNDNLRKMVDFMSKQNYDMELMWKDTMADQDYQIVLQVAKETRARIELIEKIRGSVGGNNGPTTNNFVNIQSNNTKAIKDYIHLLERAGFIQKLKSYPWEANAENLIINIKEGDNPPVECDDDGVD